MTKTSRFAAAVQAKVVFFIASLGDFNLIHTIILQNGNFGPLSRRRGTLRSTLSGARSSWSGPHICPMNQERMRCILFHGRAWPMGVGVRSKARALRSHSFSAQQTRRAARCAPPWITFFFLLLLHATISSRARLWLRAHSRRGEEFWI